MNQWLWNLRLDLGQHLSSSALRLTEFAPALASEPAPEPTAEKASAPTAEPTAEKVSAPTAEPSAEQASQPLLFGPPRWARRSRTSGFAGSDFVPQPDGTLRCPAGHPLTVQERRPERNGSVRMVYGARLCHCRPCPRRGQCQEATTTLKPRFGPSSPAHSLRLSPLLTLLKLPQRASV